MATMRASKPVTFQGMRASTSLRSSRAVKSAVMVSRNRRSTVSTQAGFIGSPNNLIIVATTTAFLLAGRFGLAPTVKRGATAGLKLVEDPDAAGLKTGDPAGFTAVDLLGHGTLGHIAGVGIILGLKVTFSKDEILPTAFMAQKKQAIGQLPNA